MSAPLSDQPLFDLPLFDLSVSRRIHVVGVGGPGMNAIATCLVQMGHSVSGSDIRESAVVERMRSIGVAVNIGHDANIVTGCDAVVSSTAIPMSNIERERARHDGIPDLTRADMLAAICSVAGALAVAGTHGKSTTTSLLVRIFEQAGRRPNFIVGADMIDEGTGARWTGSETLIVEADESDGTHLRLPLLGTVLTNIDSDHLDHYGSLDGIVEGFERYLLGVGERSGGHRVVCIDDPNIAGIVARHPEVEWTTYGASEAADFRFDDVRSDDGVTVFRVHMPDGRCVSITSPLRGLHNVANVTGATALAVSCGVDPDHVVDAVRSFGGVGRRFEIIGSADGATFVDDYAHLPQEIDAVLSAARVSGDGWSRVVAVFQPNRYNRMSVMSSEYADAFVHADVVILTDIYASGTTPIEGVTGRLVVDAVLSRHPETELVWVQSRSELAAAVDAIVRPGDVCISMGCGDIESLPREMLALRGAR